MALRWTESKLSEESLGRRTHYTMLKNRGWGTNTETRDKIIQALVRTGYSEQWLLLGNGPERLGQAKLHDGGAANGRTDARAGASKSKADAASGPSAKKSELGGAGEAEATPARESVKRFSGRGLEPRLSKKLELLARSLGLPPSVVLTRWIDTDREGETVLDQFPEEVLRAIVGIVVVDSRAYDEVEEAAHALLARVHAPTGATADWWMNEIRMLLEGIEPQGAARR